MKLFIILRKYLEKSGPWATIWANGPLQILNPKTGLGLGQIDSAQAHSGPKPKNGFTKAQARPGWAWAWPKLIPTSCHCSLYLKAVNVINCPWFCSLQLLLLVCLFIKSDYVRYIKAF